jgi:hypothetical protein
LSEIVVIGSANPSSSVATKNGAVRTGQSGKSISVIAAIDSVSRSKSWFVSTWRAGKGSQFVSCLADICVTPPNSFEDESLSSRTLNATQDWVEESLPSPVHVVVGIDSPAELISAVENISQDVCRGAHSCVGCDCYKLIWAVQVNLSLTDGEAKDDE